MLAKMREKNKSIWLRFFIPYLIILVVPLLIGLFMYYKTSEMMSNEASKSNLILLNQAKAAIDGRLSEIELFTQQIRAKSSVVGFLSVQEPYRGSNLIRLMELRDSLADYGLYNNFVLEYALLFKNSEIALTSHKTYTIPKLYEHYLNFEGMAYAAWYERLLDDYHNRDYLPAQSVVLDGKSYAAVPYMQSFGLSSNSQGAVLMLIDDRAIRQLLGGIDVSNGGWAYIADRDGTVITSLAGGDGMRAAPVALGAGQTSGFANRRIDGKPMSVTYTTSDYNGWQYVAVQPTFVVMNKVNYIKRMTSTVLGVSLLIGLFCALYLSYRNSWPVRTMVARLSDMLSFEQGLTKDVYGAIENTIVRLASNNKELKTEIEAQMPFLRTAFLQRLLTENFMTMEEIAAQQRHIGIDLDGGLYYVAVMQFDRDSLIDDAAMLEELDVKRVVAKEIVRAVSETDVYFHDVGENKTAMLFVCADADEAACRRTLDADLERAEQLFRQKCEDRLSFAVGSGYSNLLEVPRSFEEAKRALNFLRRELEEGILWYADLPASNDNYVYPGDLEIRLINYAKAGSRREAGDILAQLRKWNLRDRQLTPYMFRLFLYDLAGSFIKLVDQASVAEAEIRDFVQRMVEEDEVLDQDAMFALVTEMFLKICDTVESRKKSHNSTMIRDILAFLDTAYPDESLNLIAVADRFHISEMYLSQFFKEQTGVNFSSYVEELRMERARQLLGATKLSVNEIALAVGYNSSNTFCRAFKRIHATTPLVYRKNAPKKPDALASRDQ